MAEKQTIEVESGGAVKLPPAIQRQMRAPVGTRFVPVTAGESLLLLFREDEDQPRLTEWAPSCTMLGQVGSFGIADLFGTLNMGQKTGVVLFDVEGQRKEVYFERGEIVFARSDQAEHRLGAVLVKRGQLSQKELDRILEEKSPGVRLGAKLIQSGLLKAKDLYEAVRNQVEEIIFSIFPMEQGSFFFFEGDFLDEDLSQFTLNTQNILMEGYRRLDEWGQLREKIPHQDVLVYRKEGVEPKFDHPHMERVHGLIEGRRTVKQLMKASGLGEFEVHRALFDLLRRGAIETVDPKAAAAEKGRTLEGLVDQYNKLYVAVLRAIRQAGKEDVLSNEQLREFFGDLDERSQQILRGVHFDLARGIAGSKETLLENIQKIGAKGSGVARVAGLEEMFRRQQLQGVLDEILNYMLFTIKNALPPEKADPFLQKVRNAHRRIRDGG